MSYVIDMLQNDNRLIKNMAGPFLCEGDARMCADELSDEYGDGYRFSRAVRRARKS
jgi:hypothetical protein